MDIEDIRTKLIERYKDSLVSSMMKDIPDELLPTPSDVQKQDFEYIVPSNIIRKFKPTQIIKKEIDTAKRELTAVVSDETRDRDGDIIESSGWKLKNFKNNPVVLWAHNYREPPIAQSVNIRVKDKQLVSRMKFAGSEFAEEIFELYVGGFLRAFSVGFDPLIFEDIDKENPWAGTRFKEQDLWEYSAVPIPSNPNALNRAVRQKACSMETALEVVKAIYKKQVTELDTIIEDKKYIICVDDLCYKIEPCCDEKVVTAMMLDKISEKVKSLEDEVTSLFKSLGVTKEEKNKSKSYLDVIMDNLAGLNDKAKGLVRDNKRE
jgi:HK97 family phage prohead protease